MPEEQVQQTTEEQTLETSTTAETDWKAEAEKWRSLSRQNERQAKANADAAKRLAEIEEAQKTAEQKAADRLAELEKSSASDRQRALSLEVALDKGLPKALAVRLQGATREELEADADALLGLVKRDEAEKPRPETPMRPKEQMKSGATGADGDPPQLSREDLRKMAPDQIEAARLKGQLKELLRQ